MKRWLLAFNEKNEHPCGSDWSHACDYKSPKYIKIAAQQMLDANNQAMTVTLITDDEFMNATILSGRVIVRRSNED